MRRDLSTVALLLVMLPMAACGGGARQPDGGGQAGGAAGGEAAAAGSSAEGTGGPSPGGSGGSPAGGSGGSPAGGSGGAAPGGSGGGQVVSCADAAPPDDAGAGGDGGDAGALPECAPCAASTACAPGLECGRPASGSCALAFCVDPFESTECCAGAGSAAICAVVDGSMSAAKRCPAQQPATASACQRQGKCLYGTPSFQTPCECVAGAWQCHACPAGAPTGGCPGAAAGQLCAYGGVHCSCQTASPQAPGTWHCNACPASPPVGACGANDYCGYAPATSCVCAATATWGCFGPG